MLKPKEIKTFLWLDARAEEAARFYAAIFRNGKIGATAPHCRWRQTGAVRLAENPTTAQRAMQEMLKMVKFDIRKLEEAAK
jgi:predicted 3-demethylubiquinone-9 3-methyltransferase (glyoxalase superfamily)